AEPSTSFRITVLPEATGETTITLPAFRVLDLDDNLPNTESNTIAVAYVEPSIPTPSLSLPSEQSSVISESFLIEISLSEEVSDFDIEDLLVENGTASNLISIDETHFTVEIIPDLPGLITITFPAGAVTDVDGQEQSNVASNALRVNFLGPDRSSSGLLDLSGRDVDGLGDGESSAYFPAPKTFSALTDFSLNDIPWSKGDLTGSYDLTFLATSSMSGIKRGGKGAFASANSASANPLLASGQDLTLGSFVASDLQGDLEGMTLNDIKVIAVYLGNETTDDGATINGIPADGDISGDTSESMRNEVEPAAEVLVVGTGGNGYSINGIDISFEVVSGINIVETSFDENGAFAITFTGLNPNTTYELRSAPNLASEFTVVPGSSATPASDTATFIDPNPTLPGKTFYQLFLSSDS
ncbi:MAG: Ig-like domain-containing protein, partial [Verrucomicrobiales bacterium]